LGEKSEMDIDTLATFGITTFDTLLSSHCNKFTTENWTQICDSFVFILRQNTPNIDRLTFFPSLSIPPQVPQLPTQSARDRLDDPGSNLGLVLQRNLFRSVTSSPNQPQKKIVR